jgi:nucleotide-binding universal stress UspA family protein
MSFDTLLVHIDGEPGTRERVQVAMRLASEMRSRVVGLYLVPGASLPAQIAATLPEDIVTRRVEEAASARLSAEAGFRDAAAAARVQTIDFRAPAEDPIEAAVTHARSADLFIVGQRDPQASEMGFAERLLATALLGAGRPLLVIPYIGAPERVGRKVLVASDGGREAARAIGDALPILERADRVHVLLATGTRETQDFTQASGRLASWLRDHRVDATIEAYDASPAEAGPLLLSRAADLDSDLLVMGGYGHSRLRELMLGGMTRTVLESMTLPVLMAH